MFNKLKNIWRKLFSFHQEIILEKLPNDFQFEKIFKRPTDVVIELGVGKGFFIKNYALQHPEKSFLGVEKYRKWTRHAAKRIQNLNLPNVRMVQSTGEVIVEKIKPNTVSEYYILFPDPWPKRRHQRRRLVQKDLIQKIHATLKPGGKLYIATDHRDYFDWIQNRMNDFLQKEFEEISDQKPSFRSNYQIKYEKEGRPIYFAHVKKR